MPDTTSTDATNAAAIQAGSQLLSTAGNVIAQSSLNKKTRKWNEKMHALSRQEALSDWAMQNAYNDPKAQMARYRDAGLNPHLIYGQTNESPTVRSADTPSWNPRSPDIDLNAAPAISAYLNSRMNEAQIDNLTAAKTVQEQEAVLKAAQVQNVVAQTESIKTGTKKTEFDLSQATGLSPYLLEAARKNVEKLSAETTQLIDNNERQAALSSTSILESMERIKNIRVDRLKAQAETANTQQQKELIKAQISQIQQGMENAKKDGDIKEENLKLLRRGQNPNDPTYLRKIGEYLEKYFPTPKEFSHKVDSTLHSKMPHFWSPPKPR